MTAEFIDTLESLAREESEGGVFHFVTKFGRAWTSPSPDSKPVPAVGSHCFFNAQVFLKSERERLTYVEGFGGDPATGFVPIHHAWLVDAAGRVVDPTWPDSDLCSYFGVPFNSDFVLRFLSDHENLGLDLLTNFKLKLLSRRNRHVWPVALLTLP